MNKRIFYFSIFLLLLFVLFLSGCDPVIVSNTEMDIELETERVEDVVNGFWKAIDNQDLYNSVWYCSGNGYEEFVRPYFKSISLLKQTCPNVVIDVYSYIRDISFTWDELGNCRAIVDIQVNRIFMGCGLASPPPQFGTMELIYCFVGLPEDEGWYIDKVDIDLVDIDF